MQTLWQTAAALGLTLVLTACGGGGGGGGSSSPTSGSGSSPSSSPSSAPSTGSGGTSSTPATTPTTSTPATTTPATTTPSSTASYHVQLLWTAPATRADGSPLPLSELSGYRVYYLLEGTDPSSDSIVPVTGGTTTSLSLTLTAAGTYTFAITAVDQSGLESSLSNPVSVPIN